MKKQFFSLILFCSILWPSLNTALISPENFPGHQYLLKTYYKNKAHFDACGQKLEDAFRKALPSVGLQDKYAAEFILGLPSMALAIAIDEKIICKVVSQSADLQNLVNKLFQDKECKYAMLYDKFFRKVISYQYFKILSILIDSNYTPAAPDKEAALLMFKKIDEAVRIEANKELAKDR